MADYYPLVARAVAGLDRNTGEARRALYERARTALVTQLRGVTPPLEEAHITRERLSLEEAIRKVEAESARRPRTDQPAAAPRPQPAPPPAPGPQPQMGEPAQRQAPQMPAPQAPRTPPPPFPSSPPPQARPPMPQAAPLQARTSSPPPTPARPTRVPVPEEVGFGHGGGFDRSAPQRPPAHYPDPAPQPPAARTAPPPRDPLHGLPTAYDFDQHQPVLDPETLRPEYGQGREYDEPPVRGRAPEDDELPPQPRKLPMAMGALIKAAISVVIVVSFLGLAYWQRGTLSSLYHAFRGSSSPVATAPTTPSSSAARPKINDRIGASGTAQPQTGPVAPPVAQRVVLYEEEAKDPQGKRYIGSVIWRTETVSPGAGKPPELAVRADVEIPERRMNMTFSIRQNTDQTLPASHTVEILFNLPADFAAGGISNVPGILMKQAEQTRGTPLSGLAVKVTSGFFLIGLSAVEADRQRNIELLKERAWFDIPIVYTNNRRAILALEKGTPGERAFAEAFATWRQ